MYCIILFLRNNWIDIQTLNWLLYKKRTQLSVSEWLIHINQAFKDEFFTRRKPRSRHIRHIRLQGDHNSNKMEQLNEEVRDREKVMRGLKNVNTSVLTG